MEPQLEAFLAIARFGTMKEASRHLYLSQSTLTNRLQSLERRLGVVLVDRGPGRKSSVLTPEGEGLLVLAERWEELTREITTIATHQAASLAVGASDSVHRYVFSNVYAKLIEDNPELDLRIYTANSDECYLKLEHREVDVAVTQYQRDLPGIVVDPFLREEMCVITRSYLPNDGGVITPGILDPMDEIRIPWGAEYQRWRSRWFGLSSGRIFVDTAHLVTMVAGEGEAWALVPHSMAQVMLVEGSFHVYRLADPPPLRVLFLAHHVRQSKSVVTGFRLFASSVGRALPNVLSF